jgi:D-3-phosphoglycerate dehydrogenase
MPQARVWAGSRLHPDAMRILEEVATVTISAAGERGQWEPEAVGADAIIVILGTTPITGPVMDRLGPQLRVVSRAGIGVDRIDSDAATARGILVVNTPDAPTESTAEHAVALMLSLCKEVMLGDRRLRVGQGFPRYGELPLGLELRGAVLGLVGLGRIGGRVAEIARVLGMRVMAYDPYISAERAQQFGVELVPSLEELLPRANIVSLHSPSTPQTYHIINAKTLALMQRGSYLINVARGALVDEDALVDALRSGHLVGAALDVFDPEPPLNDNPLFSLPNVICTPHIASYTTAGVRRMQVMASEQVAMALKGERPTSLVNPDVWEKRRQGANK